jgi:hypothetical protein
MYAEQPLIIFTDVLHYARFSGQPAAGALGGFQATLSQCLENCDSVFILVPNNNKRTTCFNQPKPPVTQFWHAGLTPLQLLEYQLEASAPWDAIRESKKPEIARFWGDGRQQVREDDMNRRNPQPHENYHFVENENDFWENFSRKRDRFGEKRVKL